MSLKIANNAWNLRHPTGKGFGLAYNYTLTEVSKSDNPISLIR